jgi:hypothetical protein
MDTKKEEKPSNQQIQIKATDERLKGEYANLMQILHTKEEFVLDFLNVFPPSGTLNARVIVSPAHFKRMVAAMASNLKRYELQYGEVSAAEEPKHSVIGFREKEEETSGHD